MITFQDKVALNENTDIPEVNKITDDNINDLKAGINTNESNISTLNTKILNITGQILWTNQDPTQSISQDTDITLSSSDYDVLEIFFNQRSYNNVANYSIRFIKSSVGTRCYIPSTDSNIYRTITKNSDTSFTISTIIGSSNNDSSLVIPIYVVGYKTGLFN